MGWKMKNEKIKEIRNKIQQLEREAEDLQKLQNDLKNAKALREVLLPPETMKWS
jgi:prefoldin subunit 5